MLTEAEFNEAAERYLNMVYRIALNWFGNVPDAEDAAQEVMLRLWRSGPPPGEEERLRYWLARVSVNVCKDLSRTPWRLHTVSLEEAAEPLAPEPEDRQVLEEVLRLPKKYRVPLYLHHYEGYSAAEVGAMLGLNVSTVRTRLDRARRKLRQQLEEG
ncbi:RNA polymerase sigma factor [Dysosmobacter sp.]|jgi:RNA polymerase sigma factor (sigma-70 family)|uniref:RNA polymerase sigma factor n=1 Tax=Dysosmobacter sp. TaxID=2591382 RepID=UPI002A9455A4|nr:RNA polymerase sigma factor [Dysosmobacter sp.]MCI6055386.1 RNA polymerase sigma factor [Dysosmobacter sp.]MDY5510716.1 RNA polymerase sigma factor [Dysosmobacter sp.]